MINYLGVAFYADDARFLIKLSQHFKYKLILVCIYPSAYYYSKLKNIEAYLLSNTAQYRVNDYSEENHLQLYDTFLEYENYLGMNQNQEASYKHVNSVYLKIQEIIKKYSISSAILSGDTRYLVKICEHILLKQGIPILYFEKGPFETTILDKKGVNANASFRNYKLRNNSSKLVLEADERIERKKNKLIRYYRLIDKVVLKVNSSKYPLLDRSSSIHLFGRKAPLKEFITFHNIGRQTKNILLILQVPVDANLIFHSPYFKNHMEIVQMVHQSLPKDVKMLIREHPLYKDQYEEDLYNYCTNNRILFNDENLHAILEKVDLVIVNNSTVGIEALEKGKPIICLGESYYDKIPGVIRYEGKCLKNQILKGLNNSPNLYDYLSYKNYLFEDELIKFHFHDKEYDFEDKNLKRKLNIN